MRNISIGLVFKYNYNWEVSIEEEFQQFRGVDNVNMPDLVYNSLNYVIPIYNSTLITNHATLWNAQVLFSPQRSNARGQLALSFDWLNISHLRLENIPE